jgi:hypothetical protein
MTPVMRRLDAIKRLCRHLEKEPRPSWYYRAQFGTNREFLVGRTEVTVNYGIHVVPPGGREGVFRSSVTVWPKGRKRGSPRQWNAGSKKPGGWNAALLRLDWYQLCERELRRRDYRGTWRHSPWGRFGDFWKSHKDAASLLRETKRLEALSGQGFWGRRRATR